MFKYYYNFTASVRDFPLSSLHVSVKWCISTFVTDLKISNFSFDSKQWYISYLVSSVA